MATETYNNLMLLDQWKKFTNMTVSEVQKCMKKACSKGGQIVKKAAQQSLRTVLPNAWKRNPKYSDRLADGIRVSIFKNKDHDSAKVHVLGTRKKTSGTFRLRFFENGTFRSPNRDSDGHRRGGIAATNFFSSASQRSLPAAQAVIEQLLQQSLDKINNAKQ